MGIPTTIEEFVVPFCQCTDGSITGGWAITEPDHGSDTLSPGEKFFNEPKVKWQVQARLEGDEYVINGQKAAWVSCAPTATHILLTLQIDTAMVDRIVKPVPEVETAIAMSPSARRGRPEEVAETVIWLCSGKASFVSGHTMAVDGAYVVQ